MWQKKEEKLSLLKRLVAIPSISRTESEKEVPPFLYKECMNLAYFQENPHYLKAEELYFSALVKGKSNQTIVLISHYDVVGVDDYESKKDDAFDIEKMTAYYPSENHPCEGHEEWVYGRGTMDMKAGLVVELGLLEQAACGEFEGSILLIAVGDEEVESRGMLAATEEMKRLQEAYGLEFLLCVNTEPSFKEHPTDEQKYIYTGTIGKLLPSFYVRGQETHVGEPFAGLSANFIAAKLTEAFEYSADFQEMIDGETTQAMTSLYLRDQKPFYNVQTPTSAVCYFNLFYMEQTVAALTEKLVRKTKAVTQDVLTSYQVKAERAGVTPLDFSIQVLSYEDLLRGVTEAKGRQVVEDLMHHCLTKTEGVDAREQSAKLVADLCTLYPSNDPLIVFFYAPPFYPAVSSRHDALVRLLTANMQRLAKDSYGVDLTKRAFFQGLCDLSYVAMPVGKLKPLQANFPLLGNGYDIPFDVIQTFDFPVLNLGPFGADPHQRTERLEVTYSFEVLPDLLHHLVTECLNKQMKVEKRM